MISRYFTPERLEWQWRQIVEAARTHGAGRSRGDASPAPASPPDTVLPCRAGASLAQSRDVGRAATSAVEAAESQAMSARDLRMASPGDREETRAVVVELQELLSRCPAGALGAEGSAVVLAAVAALAQALITDRDERAALRLIRAAFPHLEFLGRRHPAVLEVRRVRAEALSELGLYRRAEKLLRRLSEDEERVFGSGDPRTALLLLWTLVGSGRSQEAEGGFRSLEARLAQPRGTVTPMLWHLRCRYSWLLGQQGWVNESVRGYDDVIIDRSHELGADHADALDARHSKGKMLVLAEEGAQAVTLLQALADDRARVQGDRHPDTLETLKYLHLARVQMEPRDDRVLHHAINDLVQILRIQDERHGPVHPLSRDTTAWLHGLFRLQERARSRGHIPDLGRLPNTGEGQSRTIPLSRRSGTSPDARPAPEQVVR
ncbi:hypothetical protein [Thermomonospora echinospora]|nr:hypothetical protein [Thermomonospora echinospora]